MNYHSVRVMFGLCHNVRCQKCYLTIIAEHYRLGGAGEACR